ncbi:hypothetical protein [Nitrosomonas sp. Nm166]|uniref:hypothetical protein n=1 Tax=Nitrosomonas sp. Nm166 TaxID=1881054 RepID=UPI0008E82B0F|nr:hypothetical protein [Nitrosomonas sp. Nm166]SFF20861.1 hypothetical protein SAMN05428977_10722 [Nitrosomonas sp. Nm166]
MAGARKDIDQFDGISLDSLPKWLRDMIDLNNESAGRETGRIKRFNLPVSDKAINAEKEKEERRFNALMRLLQDPHYARLYHHAVATVTAAEEAAEKARRKLEQESELAENRRRDLLGKAEQLPDGTKVFQSMNGRIYAEHGEDVTHRKDFITELNSNSPKWEEYQHVKKITQEIEKRKQDVEHYHREIIDPAKNRLSDVDQPLSAEELEKLVKKIKTEMPMDVRVQQNTYELATSRINDPVRNETADELFGSYQPNAPKIQADFKTAHDEPYGSSATSLPTTIPKFT